MMAKEECMGLLNEMNMAHLRGCLELATVWQNTCLSIVHDSDWELRKLIRQPGWDHATVDEIIRQTHLALRAEVERLENLMMESHRELETRMNGLLRHVPSRNERRELKEAIEEILVASLVSIERDKEEA